MRGPSPTKTHRPKDFCTLEQAAYIAQQAIIRHEAAKRRRQWHRRVWRRLTGWLALPPAEIVRRVRVR